MKKLNLLLKDYISNSSHFVPVMVWLGTLICVVMLFFHRSQNFEVLGIAQSRTYEIAATSSGRLKNITVQLFEEVREGQIVAVLDDEYLQAELATARAKIQQLTAELASTKDLRETDWITRQRQFSLDVESAKLMILELRTSLETDRIVLEDLELDVKILQGGVEKGIIEQYELDKVKVQYNILAKKIEENENLLEQAVSNLREAEQRQYEFAQHEPNSPSIDISLEPIRQSIKVQEQVINELLVEHKELVLRSPSNGIVNQIQHSLGEAVMAGEFVLVIAETKPREIIAYASETQIRRFQKGAQVTLIKNSQPAQIANSQVMSVGSTIEMIPERLWQNPSIPKWGCPILIKIPQGLELLPGELVGIKG